MSHKRIIGRYKRSYGKNGNSTINKYINEYNCLGCAHISVQEKPHIEHTKICDIHQNRLTAIVNDINEETSKLELIELTKRYVALETEMIELRTKIEKLKSERLHHKNEHERLYDENKHLREERENLRKENKCLSRKIEHLEEENNKMKTAKSKRTILKTTEETVEITYV